MAFELQSQISFIARYISIFLPTTTQMDYYPAQPPGKVASDIEVKGTQMQINVDRYQNFQTH